MNLSDHVTSLELSKKLKELGVKQESLFYHLCYNDSKRHLICLYGQFMTIGGNIYDEKYSAFTASELLEMLQDTIDITKETSSNEYLVYGIRDKNLSNALAKMLIHLIENKIIEV